MRLNRKVVFCSILVAFIIFSLLCGIYFSIPFFLEKKLLPHIAEAVGFTNSTCEVRKFSLTRLDLASLQWGESENPFLSFDSVRFDYSLTGLFKKHVNKIIISGVEIRVEYKDGRFVVPGVDFEKIFKSPAETKPENPNDSQQQLLPISFGEFEVRNATIILKSGDTNFRIPFGIKARPFPITETDTPSSYDLQLWLCPNLTNPLPALKVASRIDIHSTLNFKTHDVSMRLNLSGMNIEYHGYQLQNSPGNMPLTIEVTKKQDVIHVNFSRFCIISPFPIEIYMDRNTDCHLRFSQEGMDIHGKIYVNFNKELLNKSSDFGLKLVNSEALPLRFKGKKRGNNWHFCLNSSRANKPLQFRGQTETFGFYPEIFSIRGKGTASRGNANFSMKMSDITYDSDSVHMGSPNFRIYGNSSIHSSHYPIIKAFMKLTDAEFKTGSLYAGKIDAKIPFQWPYPSLEMEKIEYRNEEKRYCTIDKLKYYDMDIGMISSVPYQDGIGICFTGQYKDLVPNFRIDFSGRAGMSNEGNFVSKVDFKASEYERFIKIDLGKFSPQLTGMFFEGNLDINGNCKLIGSTITSSALITMHNSKIEVPGKKMALEGIDLDLDMQDLYNFHSAPDQVLKFKRFAWGDIEMNEGEAEFQIESSSSFFLKKSSFSWCGGHIYTHGLHVKSGKRELDIICYCDRLKLATILKQFKAANADGEGAVNGRIPVSYKGVKI